MKNCPNCNSEVEDNFDLCWNGNYSFIEDKLLEINEFVKWRQEFLYSSKI